MASTRKPWRTVLIWTLAAIAPLYLVGLGYFYNAMRQSPDSFGKTMMHVGPVPFLLFPFETMWMHARAGSLASGAQAPDFTLPLLDKSGFVQLSQFRNLKPVALIFGSYT